MKICICSDSHGRYELLELICEQEKPDALFFLGDGERDAQSLQFGGQGLFAAVRGNCDYAGYYPVERVITLEGKRLLLTHGHLYQVKSGLSHIVRHAQEVEADVIVYGHTHRADAQIIDNKLFLNPGAVSGTPGSYLLLDLEEQAVRYVFRQL